MGIIYVEKGKPYVYEATQPVKLTAFNDWIKRGIGSRYVVKRLKNDKLLTPEKLEKMRVVGDRYNGKNYDIYFEWSDDRMYCSELVWKIYKETLGIEIGKLQPLSSFDLSNDIVKTKLKERYGEAIPLQEKVISPAAMFESDQLVMVMKK